MEDYKPMEAWERALKTIMPNNYEPFRFFAIHNADLGPNGHEYRREESWEFKETADKYLQNLKDHVLDRSIVDKVQQEFVQMMMASKVLLQTAYNTELITEMNPWLKQFSVLGEIGLATSNLQSALLNDNKMYFDQLYDYIKVL